MNRTILRQVAGPVSFVLIVLVCWFVAGMATGAMAKEWKTVRIGVDASYPPFESKAPNGDIVGFDADLTRALCAKMNVKCVWVTQDLDGIIPALKARKFDAIVSSLSVTDKRREQIDFSDKMFDAPARMAGSTGKPSRLAVPRLDGSTGLNKPDKPTQRTTWQLQFHGAAPVIAHSHSD